MDSIGSWWLYLKTFLIGRDFMRAVDRHNAAADRLDRAVRDLLQR